MSKASELDQKVKRYILECVDSTGYDVELVTMVDKIRFLKETFEVEYGHEINRLGYTGALEHWFSGLPSACTIAFYYSDTLEIARAWGSLPDNATERQEQKILDNWFNLIACKTRQLFTGYHLPPETENGRD